VSVRGFEDEQFKSKLYGRCHLCGELHVMSATARVTCIDNSRHQTYLLPYFTREEAEQLGLDGYKTDTFSSDYDAEFGTEFDAHGA
jgi:hypothetical protein